MIRRSPAERYIRYLLCHPRHNSTRQQILETCELAQLDPIGVDYLIRLEEELDIPDGFVPHNRRHWPSQQFLIKTGIFDLFFPTDSVRAAQRLLRNARVKEFLETMTLLGAPLDAIAEDLALSKGVECSVEDLRTYQRFFWDLTLVDSSEARALLYLRYSTTHMGTRFNGDVPRPHDAANQVSAFAKAPYSDPRCLAAMMPASPYTALVAQMRMGYLPLQVDARTTLETAEKMVAIRLLESAAGSGPLDAERINSYTSSIKNLREVITNMSPPEEALKRQIETFAIQMSSARVPVLAEVTGGKHTTQLLPDSVLRGQGEREDEDV